MISYVYLMYIVSHAFKTEYLHGVFMSPKHVSSGRKAPVVRCHAATTRTLAYKHNVCAFPPPRAYFISFPPLILAEPGKAAAV